MKTGGLFFLLYLLSVTPIPAQRRTDTLVWSERRLTWDDFRDSSSRMWAVPFGAKISVLLSCKIPHYKKTGGSFKPLVMAVYFPQRSWVKPDIRSSDRILRHEQVHFDMVELFARRLRKDLEGLIIKDKTTWKQARRMHRSVKRELKNMQWEYDSRTTNGSNNKEQAKWNAWIFSALQETDDHKMTPSVAFADTSLGKPYPGAQKQ
jgi:hypothetical protein